MSALSTVMMTLDEAEHVHKRIVARDKAQARDLQSMYDLEGWKALGYTSWDAYMSEAFDYSKSYISRLNDRVQINHELGAGSSPLPERQTRVLKKLTTVEARQEAYHTAKSLAHAEDNSLSLRHIQMAVNQLSSKQMIRDSKHRVITVMMDSGDISISQAIEMVDMLDQLDDLTYAKVITIIAEYGLSDATLIPQFADMVNRQSDTLKRILATGYINNQPIGSASVADLQIEKQETRIEKIADARERKRQEALEQGKSVSIAHMITVWENDPKRTINVLCRTLPQADLKQLSIFLQEVV